MKILTKRKQDEILKTIIQLIGSFNGMMSEEAGDCIVDIIYLVAGEKGLEEVAKTTTEQAKLMLLSLKEIIRLQEQQEGDIIKE